MGSGGSRPPSRTPPTNPPTPLPITPRPQSVQSQETPKLNIPAAPPTPPPPSPPPVSDDDDQGQPKPTDDDENSTQEPVDLRLEDFFHEFPTPKLLRECNQLALRQIDEKQPIRADDGSLRIIPPRLTRDQLLDEDDYRRLDDLASDVSDDLLQRSVEDLARRLHRDTKNAAEFVRVAYRWVFFQLIRRAKASDIRNEDVTKTDASNVVDVDSTVKEMTAFDYMRQIKAAKKNLNELLHHILMAGGLEVTLVSGVVKSDGHQLSTTLSTAASVTISKTGQIVKAVEPADETQGLSLSYRKWLAVAIDDNWFLIDAMPVIENYMEDEPQADEDQQQPISSPTKQREDIASPGASVEKVITSIAASGSRQNFDSYFLSAPEIMVYSHFPAAEDNWQLLYRPATIDEFIQMADLTPAFFRYRLELGNQPYRSFEHNETGPCELVFGQPADAHYRFNYRLTRSNSGSASTSSSSASSSTLDRFVFIENLSTSGQVKCTLRFPSVGKYLFELFCCKSSDDITDGGLYLLVCRYQIDATRPAAEVRPLPENRFREWGPGWKLTQAGLDATAFISGDHSKSGTIDIDRNSETPGEVDISFNINQGNDDSKYLVQITSDTKSKSELSRYSVLFVHSVNNGGDGDDNENERYLTVKAKFVEKGWYAMTLLAKVDDDVPFTGAAGKRKSGPRFERVCCYLIRVTRAAADQRPYPKVSGGRLGRTEQGARLGIYPLSHRTSFFKVVEEKEEVILDFASTEPCHFLVELRLQIDPNDSSKKFDDMTFIEERADGAKIRVRFPEKGLYTIRIFGRPQNSSGACVPVFTYIADVNQPTVKFGPYPRKFIHWTEGCQLVQPQKLAGVLPANSFIPFSVNIPKALEVKLTKSTDDLTVKLRRWRNMDENDNEHHETNVADDDSKNKDLWTEDFNTGDEGELILYAAFDATLQFKILLTFQVIDVGGRVTFFKKSIKANEPQQPSQLPVKNTQPPPVNSPVQAARGTRGPYTGPEPTPSRLSPPLRRSETLNQSSAATEQQEWIDRYRTQFYEELRQSEEQQQREKQRREVLERTRQRAIEQLQLEEARVRQQAQSLDRRPQNVYGDQADQRVTRIREDLKRSTLQRDSVGLTAAVGDAERYHLEDVIGDDYYRARDVKKSLNRVDKLKTALICLDRATLNEIRAYNVPPEPLHRVVSATLLVLGIPEQLTMTWQNCQRYFSTVGQDNLLRRVHLFDVGQLPPEIAARAERILRDCRRKDVRAACFGAAILYDWTAGVCDECLTMNGSKEVKPATGERQRQLLLNMSSALRMN